MIVYEPNSDCEQLTHQKLFDWHRMLFGVGGPITVGAWRIHLDPIKVINRMLDEGPDGFDGGMNARKYVGITKVSKATATRDIQQLVELGVFERFGEAGGRSTRYRVML